MTKQELKLCIASQCLAGILANPSDWVSDTRFEELAQHAWTCATELVKLSEQEEKTKRSLWHKEEEVKNEN